MLRESYTAVIERSAELSQHFATEPYECGWASEAIFFVRTLEVEGDVAGTILQIQISPDGIRWCNEGTNFTLTDDEVNFCKVKHFGNWLRITGTLPDGAKMKAIIALNLKA